MDLNTILVFTPVILAVLAIVILLIRVLMNKGPYIFEIIIMRPGVNKHLNLTKKDLGFIFKEGEFEYEVKSDSLYRIRPSFREKITFKFKGIRAKFLILFKEGSKSPIKSEKPKVSSHLLFTVQESKALDKALHEEFKVEMSLKKIIMFLGAGIIIVVVYLVMTGQVG